MHKNVYGKLADGFEWRLEFDEDSNLVWLEAGQFDHEDITRGCYSSLEGAKRFFKECLRQLGEDVESENGILVDMNVDN